MNYNKIIIQRSIAFNHMLYIFLFEGYSRKTSKYLKIIITFDLAYMMSMVDLVMMGMEIPMIDNRCSLEKKFTKWIHMNP